MSVLASCLASLENRTISFSISAIRSLDLATSVLVITPSEGICVVTSPVAKALACWVRLFFLPLAAFLSSTVTAASSCFFASKASFKNAALPDFLASKSCPSGVEMVLVLFSSLANPSISLRLSLARLIFEKVSETPVLRLPRLEFTPLNIVDKVPPNSLIVAIAIKNPPINFWRLLLPKSFWIGSSIDGVFLPLKSKNGCKAVEIAVTTGASTEPIVSARPRIASVTEPRIFCNPLFLRINWSIKMNATKAPPASNALLTANSLIAAPPNFRLLANNEFDFSAFWAMPVNLANCFDASLINGARLPKISLLPTNLERISNAPGAPTNIFEKTSFNAGKVWASPASFIPNPPTWGSKDTITPDKGAKPPSTPCSCFVAKPAAPGILFRFAAKVKKPAAPLLFKTLVKFRNWLNRLFERLSTKNKSSPIPGKILNRNPKPWLSPKIPPVRTFAPIDRPINTPPKGPTALKTSLNIEIAGFKILIVRITASEKAVIAPTREPTRYCGTAPNILAIGSANALPKAIILSKAWNSVETRSSTCVPKVSLFAAKNL